MEQEAPRPELRRPEVDEARLAAVRGCMDEIEDRLLAGGDVAGPLRRLNELTGRDYEADDFDEHCVSLGFEEMALAAVLPVPRRYDDITRDELIWLVEQVMVPDRLAEHYLAVLQANVVRPGVSDLIFHPPPELRDATAAEIVDAVLAYRPIALPGPGGWS